MQRDELARIMDVQLEAAKFHDYCPNGLQVEGRREVSFLVCGVTASLALIEEAIARGADALLVHHGWFWKSEERRLVGQRRQRLARLLAHDINLYAYHLPLDAHPELGNNAQLAALMGWQVEGNFAEQAIGFHGRPASSGQTAAALARQLEQRLGRTPLLVGDATRPVQRIAWCSGGAQDWFESAIAAGADAFITGEISEPQAHLARETGVAFIAAGHHATERYGAPAVAAHVAQQLGLEHQFIDIDNPA